MTLLHISPPWHLMAASRSAGGPVWATSGFPETKLRRGKKAFSGGQFSYLHVKGSPRCSRPSPTSSGGGGLFGGPSGGVCDPRRLFWEQGGGICGRGRSHSQEGGGGLRAKGSRPRAPASGNFMGVVICGTGRLRPTSTPAPHHLLQGQKSPGKVVGGVLQAPPRRPRR